ncbi:MAG TPA: phospho-N-acetylmuramoyl-pentapeptide-transferase, partial [Castellaniella sp.]|nr:phospho-N-acetylmuramoyl-pentapeptide-transferase [Castellaniella sp.]
LLCGPVAIRLLATLCRETIREDSPRLRSLMSVKAATPSMGGLLILAGFLAGSGWFTSTSDPLVQGAVVLALGLAALGAWDDLSKRDVSRRGLSARAKLCGQTLLAVIVVHCFPPSLPSVSTASAVLLIVGLSNAVNLADGLDGLASGCALIVLASVGVLAMLADAGSNSLILIVSLAGAVLGFLWFNRHPARVFMGDTGSLPLGGLLGWFIVGLDNDVTLLVACGVFLVEAASVVLQVGWFKWTGNRVFLCAPLHHHFQFLGWSERRIVRSFWIAGLACAVAALGIFLTHPTQP